MSAKGLEESNLQVNWGKYYWNLEIYVTWKIVLP